MPPESSAQAVVQRQTQSRFREPEPESNIIPNSAVASSDNCAKVAELEEQFEFDSSTLSSERIQGPEQHRAMRASEKFRLAVSNLSDPLSLVVTGIDSEVGAATDGPSPLRSGAAGFGQRFGASMAGQASSEFMSTFLISSLFHQDPHYHRDDGDHTSKRILRAFSYVVVTRSDSGKRMFNFAEFLGTTSTSILENNFHPEWQKGTGPTAHRIFVSIGSDAAWNLLTEFLPDVAKHLNPRLILLRQLAQKAAEQN